ncbi:hypothetical protein CN984_12170 [Bacillus cereus]|uniref:Phage ABA sandwich domain-containing protein n=1 Tax=Bacillus cereus TaxID=1396 RepID=A0A2B9Q3Z7_BACCE|nr:hypothetical protein [Bacillus cereus]PGO29195.1 hypothetical protein CN984_12170 [Bacillus cereus]
MEVDFDRMIKQVLGLSSYIAEGEEFSPSTNMNHTLLVIERLKGLGFSTLLRDCANEDCGLVRSGQATRKDYYCNVSHGSVYSEKLRYKSVASTAQMAVCLSALKAVGVIGVIDND